MTMAMTIAITLTIIITNTAAANYYNHQANIASVPHQNKTP